MPSWKITKLAWLKFYIGIVLHQIEADSKQSTDIYSQYLPTDSQFQNYVHFANKKKTKKLVYLHAYEALVECTDHNLPEVLIQ